MSPSSIWSHLTRNWRAPFDARQATFGYWSPDGTFYPGYLTRGGEMRYEKRGIPPTYDPAEYVESRSGTESAIEYSMFSGVKRHSWPHTIHIYRRRNRSTGKHRYWDGSSTTVRWYIDSEAYVKGHAIICAETPSEA